MNLRLFGSAFVTIFLAELGDKTQLTTLTLAATSNAKWSVFAGSALALVTSSLIAVLLADQIEKHVKLRYVEGAAGVMLLIMGIYTLVQASRGA
ncbi:MAG: TMEM165/GDT1 family protein [Polyangiaceae bacterium]